MQTELAPIESSARVRPLATWQSRRPWLWAIAIGLGGVVLTAFGAGFSQVRGLGEPAATYTQAAFVGASALIGLVIMWRTRPSLAEYGFRRPRATADALWLVPLVALPVILLGSARLAVTPSQALAYSVLAIAVGFSEEIWFRGLLLAALRRLGRRRAVVGASAVFGALHLTNLLGGGDPTYVGLQFAFACLVGFVLAELVEITGSLWIGIVWHALYDLVALSVGDSLTTGALVGVAAMTAVLVGYAGYLWHRLPNDAQLGQD